MASTAARQRTSWNRPSTIWWTKNSVSVSLTTNGPAPVSCFNMRLTNWLMLCIDGKRCWIYQSSELVIFYHIKYHPLYSLSYERFIFCFGNINFVYCAPPKINNILILTEIFVFPEIPNSAIPMRLRHGTIWLQPSRMFAAPRNTCQISTSRTAPLLRWIRSIKLPTISTQVGFLLHLL